MPTVEFIHYNQQFYPPVPCKVECVAMPDSADLHPPEALTEELAYIPDTARRLGLLATNQWFDLTRFRLSAAAPPEKSVYHHDIPANLYRPYSYRLKNSRHLGRAHSAFLSTCLTADYREEGMTHRQLGDETKSERTIEDFILHPLAWDQKIHSLDYLLVSRGLAEGIAIGAITSARHGTAQQNTIERLASGTQNPYTSLPDEFLAYLAS